MSVHAIEAILISYPRSVDGSSVTGMTEAHLDVIRRAAPGARLLHVDDAEWKERADVWAPKVGVAMGWLDHAQLAALPNLRWLQQTAAGVDWLLRAPALAASELVVTNVSGLHAIPIAEHVLALMLGLSRRLHHFVKAQRDREWVRRGRLAELEGATLGVVGLGAIGEKTAEKAKGIGMRVVAMRRHPERTSPHVEQMFGPDGLLKLLAQSDWVVIAAALTHETRSLIGARELRAMKPSAYLINIARGSVVDERALIRALEEGEIAGAGLDVFEQEPLPPESPLWDMRNVILTPHFAGATPHYADRVLEIFIDNLERFQRGERLRNVVDKQLGY